MTYKEMFRIREAIKTGDVDYVSTLNINWKTTFLTEASGNTVPPIHYAAKYGQLAVVEYLLETDATLLDFTDADNQTAIRFAAANNRLAVVEHLARCGANLNLATNAPESDVHGYAPIHWATSRGYHTVVQCLLDYGAVTNRHSGEQNFHVIHIASKNGHVEAVRVLLAHDPDLLNLPDSLNRTPIALAAFDNRLSVVEHLVERHADLTIAADCPGQNGDKYLPIHWACAKDNYRVVQCLIDHGADANMLLPMQQHIIHIASGYGSLEVVRILLEREPDLLNFTDAFNCTPIFVAAANNKLAVVMHLTEVGADLTIAAHCPGQARSGYLPIHCATEFGNDKIVQHLMDQGADIHMRLGEIQHHLIHIAAKYGSLKVVKVLLRSNPSLLNLPDIYDQTPVLLASVNGHAAVVEYLISKRADLEVITNRLGHPDDGKTALIRAIEKGHGEVENLLLLARTPSHDKRAILPCVRTGDHALALMVLDPTLTSLFMQDERVQGLMTTSSAYTSSESFRWYGGATVRRPSFFAEIDKATRTISVFRPARELGRGAYGIVRLFETVDHRTVAVKSLIRPVNEMSETARNNLKKMLRREVKFKKEAYPDTDPSELFEFEYQTRKGKINYTNRYVMSYIEGETLNHVTPKITCPYQLADITLQIIKEVARIHRLGILHGDLNIKNIMIYRCGEGEFRIRLIDFGFASYMSESSARLWNPGQAGRWMPPEICNGRQVAVKPHPNQDVFALGYTLNIVLQHHPTYQRLLQLFPCINTFILGAKNREPSCRPTLEGFTEQLSHTLYPNDTTGTCMDAPDTEFEMKQSALVEQLRASEAVQDKGGCVLS